MAVDAGGNVGVAVEKWTRWMTGQNCDFTKWPLLNSSKEVRMCVRARVCVRAHTSVLCYLYVNICACLLCL